MLKKKMLLSIIALTATWSCVELTEPKMFSWKTSFDFPITTQSIVLKDKLDMPALKDAIITIDSVNYKNGYIYTDTIGIPEQAVGDQFSVDDMEPQTMTQNVDDVKVEGSSKYYSTGFDTVGVETINKNISSKLGIIELDNTDAVSTDPIKFTDIFKGLPVPVDDNPININITQGEEFPTIYRDIIFTEFDGASFTEGELSATIYNNLVIELGHPITLSLLKTDSSYIIGSDGDTATMKWDPGIDTALSRTESIFLANKTLPGNIIIKIEGSVCGSGARTVQNTTATQASSFSIDIETFDLKVDSAMAEVISQTIKTAGDIHLKESGNKVKSAKILSGILDIVITNNLSIEAVMDLTILSIDDLPSGVFNPLKVENIRIPPGAVDKHVPKLLNNYYLNMDVNNQKVSYEYIIRTVDTGNEKVPVTSSDSVEVDINLFGSVEG
ncbi:MAG: hypothetical protein KAI81_09445, partial [Candidatus Marinimicrobia bacterium]|nr:hypothetical protein [Candidatus Neomarinimicrobiota bacterium]